MSTHGDAFIMMHGLGEVREEGSKGGGAEERDGNWSLTSRQLHRVVSGQKQRQTDKDTERVCVREKKSETETDRQTPIRTKWGQRWICLYVWRMYLENAGQIAIINVSVGHHKVF